MPSTERLREELDEARGENEVLRGEIEQLQHTLMMRPAPHAREHAYQSLAAQATDEASP